MEPGNSVSPNSQTLASPVKASSKLPILIAGGFAIILIGLGIGWIVSSKKSASFKPTTLGSSVIMTQTEAGAKDASAFKDTATGILQKGGIKGEGTFHLDRPGGATQTVYINSTIIDMNPFVGKKVQVWGQTVTSQHAPWLMDVGRIKVVQ